MLKRKFITEIVACLALLVSCKTASHKSDQPDPSLEQGGKHSRLLNEEDTDPDKQQVPQPEPPPAQEKRDQTINQPTYTPIDLDATLIIDKVSLANFNHNGSIMPLGTIETTQSVDFFQYSACKDERTCQPVTTPSRSFIIPGLAPGSHEIQARACRKEQTAERLVLNCGPWWVASYVQPSDSNQALDDLLSKKVLLENKVRSLGLDVFQQIQSYSKHIKSCGNEKVKKLLPPELADKFLRLGPALIGLGLLDPEVQLVLNSETGEYQVVMPSSLEGKLSGTDTSSATSASKEEKDKGKDISATVTTAAGFGVAATSLLRQKVAAKAVTEGGKLSSAAGTKISAEVDKINKRYSTASTVFKVVLVGGLLYYLIQNNETDPSKFLEGFVDNALLTDAASPCKKSALAVQEILTADKKARVMRLEIRRYDRKIKNYADQEDAVQAP